MSTYFSGCNSPDDYKARYRELAKKLHPDRNAGNDNEFKLLNLEYQQYLTHQYKTFFYTDPENNNRKYNAEEKAQSIKDTIISEFSAALNIPKDEAADIYNLSMNKIFDVLSQKVGLSISGDLEQTINNAIKYYSFF